VFIELGIVSSWDDPRFPTIQGLCRRGLKLKALKDFIIDIGNSIHSVLMDVNKLWSFNKQFIDTLIPRYSFVKQEGVVEVIIEDMPDVYEEVDILRLRGYENLGYKKSLRYNKIYIDQSDAHDLADGEEFTTLDWGNMIIQSKHKDGDKITRIVVKSHIGGDFKKTQKITWVAVSPKLIPIKIQYFDNLITVPKIPSEKKEGKKKGKQDDFEKYINKESKIEHLGLAEPCITELEIGQSIQFTRRGYFMLDAIEEDGTRVFVNTPDGHSINVWK